MSATNTRPVQFALRTIPSAATFIDKQGSEWNEANIAEYFSVMSTDEGNKRTQRNTQRHQRSQHHCSMRRITSCYGQGE